MSQQRNPTIERTLLIGVTLGLLIGLISKRVGAGLLVGIGLSIFIALYLRGPNKRNEK